MEDKQVSAYELALGSTCSSFQSSRLLMTQEELDDMIQAQQGMTAELDELEASLGIGRGLGQPELSLAATIPTPATGQASSLPASNALQASQGMTQQQPLHPDATAAYITQRASRLSNSTGHLADMSEPGPISASREEDTACEHTATLGTLQAMREQLRLAQAISASMSEIPSTTNRIATLSAGMAIRVVSRSPTDPGHDSIRVGDLIPILSNTTGTGNALIYESSPHVPLVASDPLPSTPPASAHGGQTPSPSCVHDNQPDHTEMLLLTANSMSHGMAGATAHHNLSPVRGRLRDDVGHAGLPNLSVLSVPRIVLQAHPVSDSGASSVTATTSLDNTPTRTRTRTPSAYLGPGGGSNIPAHAIMTISRPSSIAGPELSSPPESPHRWQVASDGGGVLDSLDASLPAPSQVYLPTELQASWPSSAGSKQGDGYPWDTQGLSQFHSHSHPQCQLPGLVPPDCLLAGSGSAFESPHQACKGLQQQHESGGGTYGARDCVGRGSSYGTGSWDGPVLFREEDSLLAVAARRAAAAAAGGGGGGGRGVGSDDLDASGSGSRMPVHVHPGPPLSPQEDACVSMYYRDLAAKKRLEERQAAFRFLVQNAELEVCSFRPDISPGSKRLTGGKSPPPYLRVKGRGMSNGGDVPEETHERLYHHAKVQARNISHLKQTLDMVDQEQREFRARRPRGRGPEPKPRYKSPGPHARKPPPLPTGLDHCTFQPTMVTAPPWSSAPSSGGVTHNGSGTPVDDHRGPIDPILQAFDVDAAFEFALYGQVKGVPTNRRQAASARPPVRASLLASGSACAAARKSSTQFSSRKYTSASSTTGSMAGSAAASRRHKRPTHVWATPARPPEETVATANDDNDGQGPPHVVVDWDQFMSRQQRHLKTTQHKMALATQAAAKEVGRRQRALSPGSQRILSHKQQVGEGYVRPQDRPLSPGPSGSRIRAQGTSHHVSGHRASSAGSRAHHQHQQWSDDVGVNSQLDDSYTFAPKISPLAAARPPPTIDELHDGGKAAREMWLAEQRLIQAEMEAQQMADFVARPNPQSQAGERLSLLSEPGKYLEAWAARKKTHMDRLAQEHADRERHELAACTFVPQTTPLPAYILRQHMMQLKQQATSPSHGRPPRTQSPGRGSATASGPRHYGSPGGQTLTVDPQPTHIQGQWWMNSLRGGGGAQSPHQSGGGQQLQPGLNPGSVCDGQGRTTSSGRSPQIRMSGRGPVRRAGQLPSQDAGPQLQSGRQSPGCRGGSVGSPGRRETNGPEPQAPRHVGAGSPGSMAPSSSQAAGNHTVGGVTVVPGGKVLQRNYSGVPPSQGVVSQDVGFQREIPQFLTSSMSALQAQFETEELLAAMVRKDWLSGGGEAEHIRQQSAGGRAASMRADQQAWATSHFILTSDDSVETDPSDPVTITSRKTQAPVAAKQGGKLAVQPRAAAQLVTSTPDAKGIGQTRPASSSKAAGMVAGGGSASPLADLAHYKQHLTQLRAALSRAQ